MPGKMLEKKSGPNIVIAVTIYTTFSESSTNSAALAE
jgi:hypothetical protein